jgi:hypothetical protein
MKMKIVDIKYTTIYLILLVWSVPFFSTSCCERVPSQIQAGTIDQSNVPQWTGAWTNIVPENQVTQSFKPRSRVLLGVDIYIVTGNPGRGGDSITLKVSRAGETLATVSQFAPEGFDGLLHFKMPSPIDVVPGEVLKMIVCDTGKVAFGWKYEENTYIDGTGFSYGRPLGDFFFQTYGRP